MPIEFCPICHNYMYLDTSNDSLTKTCKTCGNTKKEEKGGLIMETILQAKSSEEYKYIVNEFTKEDPRLPHFKTLKCPNGQCPTVSGGQPSDVIVIKYDQKNLRFVYICNICSTEWRSGTR